MTEVLAEAAPDRPRAILSGPSFAADVAAGLPTAVTLASADAELARAQIRRPAFYLLRPDGYIGLCGPRLDSRAVTTYFRDGLGLDALDSGDTKCRV